MTTIDQIASIDTTLRTLKEAFDDAPLDKRDKWTEKINRALEERFTLMQIRDCEAPYKTP